MSESLHQMLGWMVALGLGVAFGVGKIWDRIVGSGRKDGRMHQRGEAQTESLADHERRIRALESSQADMRKDMAEVKTNVQWIRDALEKSGK